MARTYLVALKYLLINSKTPEIICIVNKKHGHAYLKRHDNKNSINLSTKQIILKNGLIYQRFTKATVTRYITIKILYIILHVNYHVPTSFW